MKRRLCKSCRAALKVDWAQKGVEGCGTCNGSFLQKVIQARPNKKITASSIGSTDGWEDRRGGS